jgi:hypothetical protein
MNFFSNIEQDVQEFEQQEHEYSKVSNCLVRINSTYHC